MPTSLFMAILENVKSVKETDWKDEAKASELFLVNFKNDFICFECIRLYVMGMLSLVIYQQIRLKMKLYNCGLINLYLYSSIDFT